MQPAKAGSQLVQALPLPGPDFDALTAPAAELDKYGLPPRPNPKTQPQLYDAWRRMFAPPVTFVAPKLVQAQFGPTLVVQPEPAALVSGETRFDTSANWCGTYVQPFAGRMFVEMHGEWTLPTLSLPPPIDQVPPGGPLPYKCSAWIGLDGQRRYLNSSLPQIGVEQTLTVAANGTQTPAAAAWFQWWARDETTVNLFYWSGLAMQPGDQIRAHIHVVGLNMVHAHLRNQTTGQIAGITATPPAVQLPNGGPLVQPSIAGATAEWIMERPTVLGQTTLFPFPQYTPTVFSHCLAQQAAGPGQPGVTHVLKGARFIRMYEVRETPSRTAFISMPTKLNDSEIRVRYGGF